jgi:hypothetical protein
VELTVEPRENVRMHAFGLSSRLVWLAALKREVEVELSTVYREP